MSETVAQDIEIPPELKGKPAQIDAYRAIATAEEPVRPSEISDETGRSIDSTNRAVGKMKERGLIKRIDHGLYTLPSHENTGRDDSENSPQGRGESDDVVSLLRNTTMMKIHTDVRPSAGNGRIVYPNEKTHHVDIPTGLLAEVIGFRPPSRIGIMWADGDSMEPTVRDEEMVIYKPIDQIRSAGVFTVYLTHGLVVKRLFPHSDGTFTLISDNDGKGYPDETLIPTDSDDQNHFIKESTERTTHMYPVGKVLFPDRDTDKLHITQVTQMIRGILKNGDANAKAIAR